MTLQDTCPNCFQPHNGQSLCPHCGHDMSKGKKYADTLPCFTVLKDRYLVGRVLGKGGFGITYLAMDIYQNVRCAVKEYMPSEYCERDRGSLTVEPKNDSKSYAVYKHGREKFIEEANTLSKLKDNPIVVDIWAFFEQNNTAYLVMEYLEGTDLKEAAKANGGKLDPDYVKTIFVTIASSLMSIHEKKILHRDLSPDNIIVTNDGRIKLIDFGAARSFVSDQNKGMSVLLKPGYAPPEQYDKQGNQGPWTDVYALCATFYKLVSGKTVEDLSFRANGVEQPTLLSRGVPVSKRTSDVINKGLEMDYKKRYQNFKQLLDDIDMPAPKPKQESKQESKPDPKPEPKPDPKPEHKPEPKPEPKREPKPEPTPPKKTPKSESSDGGFFARLFGKSKKESQDPVSITIPVKEPPKQPPVNHGPYKPNPSPNRNPTPIPVRHAGGQSPAVSGRGNPPDREKQIQPKLSELEKRVPYVALVKGNQLIHQVHLGENQTLIVGRSQESCQYVVSGDQNVSRRHCEVRYKNDQLYIKDISSNGTYYADGTRFVKDKEQTVESGTRFYLATPENMLIISY